MAKSRRADDTAKQHRNEKPVKQQTQSFASSVQNLESVSSLIRRLGTPPADLAEHLCLRFDQACRKSLDDGIPIATVVLEDWSISSGGDLVYTGSRDSNLQQPVEREVLRRQFRQQLAMPRPAATHRRNPSAAGFDTAESADRFDKLITDQIETSALTYDEQVRRAELIQKFTTSLAERFGEESVFSPTVTEEKTRTGKRQPIERHRRFNWNLVLGVATAVAAVAMIWTGVHVNQIRLRRAETAPRPSQVTFVDTVATSSNAEKLDDALPPVPDLTRDPSENIELSDSPTSVFVENRRDSSKFDVMEELYSENLRTSDAAAKTGNTPDDLVAVPIDPIESPKFAFPGVKLDDAIDGSLESVLAVDESEDAVPDVPQQIRPSTDRFVELPRVGDSDKETTIDRSGGFVSRIEFPAPISITLSGQPDNDPELGIVNLINQESGATLAQVSSANQVTLFKWATDAGRDSLASKLINGRLVLADGESVYLRPSIESDGYPLSMNPRQSRPSWNLAGTLLPDVSRLELDLDVPDSIDLAWHTPFILTRSKRGTAIAILTPLDGETVAIAVKLDVDCSRKLTCRLQFGARLDPAMPWQPLTEAGFASQKTIRINNHRHLLLERENFKQKYEFAGVMERRSMLSTGDKLDADIELQATTVDRMELLGALAMRIQSSVTLKMHLFVEWPNSTQTILRVARNNDEK